MRVIHDVFAIINIIGCLIGMFLMSKYYLKVEFRDYETPWNIVGLMCFMFSFLAIIREIYSLLAEPISVWPFKFVTSGIYIITIAFYFLVKKFKPIDKITNDKEDE